MLLHRLRRPVHRTSGNGLGRHGGIQRGIAAADGKHHDWRADITGALAKRQQDNGSWVNNSDHWMEGDPNVVTGYALMALAHCKPKK